MRRITVWTRLIASLVVLIGLSTVLMPAAQAAETGASVEIHKRICPPGFKGDLFKVCHDSPLSGIEFHLADLSTTTNADGNAFFFNLLEGTYTISEVTIPGHDAEFVAFCAKAATPGVPLDFTYTADGIRLFVPANTAIICDWYNIPFELRDGGGSVEIHKRLCPAGFTGANLFDVCHGTPQAGVTFVLDGLAATTNAAGNVRFFNLLEGTFTITENPGHAKFVVFCARADTPGVAIDFTYVTGGIRLFVPAGTALVCDWYNIPAAKPAPAPAPPVTVLPDTGVGATVPGSLMNWSFGLLAALALSGGAYGLRRRVAR